MTNLYDGFPGNLAEFTKYLINTTSYYGYFCWRLSAFIYLALLIIICYYSIFPDKRVNFKKFRFLFTEKFFYFLIVFGIILLRLPNSVIYFLDQDEPQLLAEAMTLSNNPLFWHSVDGTTVGPISIYAVLILKLFGLSLNYANARMFGMVFCLIPGLIIIYRTLILACDRDFAKIPVIALILIIALTNNGTVIFYGSEYLVFLTMSATIFLFVKLSISSYRHHALIFYLGLLLGLFPFIKLQTVPIAFGIALVYIFVEIRKKEIEKKVKLIRISNFLGSSLLPTIIAILVFYKYDLIDEFFSLYIINNWQYATDGLKNYFGNISNFGPFIFIKLHGKAGIGFLISLSIIILLTGFKIIKNRKSITWKIYDFNFLLLSVVLLFCSYYSIIKPKNIFYHYQILFYIPLTFSAGIFLYIFKNNYCKIINNSQKFLKKLTYGFLTVTLIANSYLIISGNKGFEFTLQKVEEWFYKNRYLPVIQKYAKPDEKMAIWGWRSHCYIESGMIQGTRHSHIYFQVVPSPNQEYYLQLYAEDLKENKPVVFLDVISETSFYVTDKSIYGFDKFPEIKKIIDSNYTFISEADGVGVYIRNDRVNRTLKK
ncbi:MAG: hypothetical protein HW421_2092 [Ignavibacteria bacterium]|nr:hypothetical protein [Ignavibacteria bacterium]